MLSANDNRYILLFILMLIVLCYLVYSPLFDVGFYDEDDWYHLNFGKRIADKGFFEANVFEMLITSPELSAEHIRMIYFTQMWWSINYHWWGPVAKGHHLTAFFLLLLCIFLVFSIARQLTRSWITAMGASTLFALFPFNAKLCGNATAVVYLVLTTAFLLSIAFYLAYMRAKKLVLYSKFRTGSLYALSMFFFIISVMTQESAYGLPVMLLFTDLIYTAADSRLTLKKTALRIAPFFIALSGIIALTIHLTYKFKSTHNIDARVIDFIGLPIWKYFTVVPEGFLSPFYKGYMNNPGIRYLAFGLVSIIAITALVTWRKQRKLVLLMGLIWIVVALLPVLQVLDSVADPLESEEKYLFLPSVGFCILLAALANPRAGVSRRLRLAGICSLVALAFVYMLGTNANSNFFQSEAIKYKRAYSGVEQVMDNASATDMAVIIYGKEHQNRERLLAAFLEYTFQFKDTRPWFFMDRAMLLSVIDGRLPDLTIPAPVMEVTDNTGSNTESRGGLKYPDRFTPVMFNYSPSLHIMAVEPDTYNVIDIGQELLPELLPIFEPLYVDFEKFATSGPPSITRAPKANGKIEGWILMGNVYRLLPSQGRF